MALSSGASCCYHTVPPPPPPPHQRHERQVKLGYVELAVTFITAGLRYHRELNNSIINLGYAGVLWGSSTHNWVYTTYSPWFLFMCSAVEWVLTFI